MTFDPRPYLDSIAEEVEWGPEIDCPATTAQRIRLAGKEIDRLRADLAQRTAERDAAIDNRKILEGALIRTINSVVSQRDALAAEVAALKAEEMLSATARAENAARKGER
jgi:uncharacterized small protein (DUF1192 family)